MLGEARRASELSNETLSHFAQATTPPLAQSAREGASRISPHGGGISCAYRRPPSASCRSCEAAKRRRDVALQLACAEAAEEDWDGYGAAAVEANTLVNARSDFSSRRANSVARPQVAAHPDGAIAFEAAPLARRRRSPRARPGKGIWQYLAGTLSEEQSFGTLCLRQHGPSEVAFRAASDYLLGRGRPSAAGASDEPLARFLTSGGHFSTGTGANLPGLVPRCLRPPKDPEPSSDPVRPACASRTSLPWARLRFPTPGGSSVMVNITVAGVSLVKNSDLSRPPQGTAGAPRSSTGVARESSYVGSPEGQALQIADAACEEGFPRQVGAPGRDSNDAK